MSTSATSDPTPAPCAHPAAAAGARFCPDCGDRLTREKAKASTVIQVAQHAEEVGAGGMTGVRVGEVRGSITVVHNNVFQINDPSPELLDRLGATKRLSTEVQPGRADVTGGAPAADNGARPTEHSPRDLEQPLGEIITQVRAAERRGERVDAVTAGSLRFTRAELNLKEAVLLIADADQMFFDDAAHEGDDASSMTGDRFEVDVEGMEDTHTASLRQALALLVEARELEPTNAEVLLHLAKVMDKLDENPREVRKVLYQVQRLLDPPRTDVDRFHLAQATYLLAVAGETPHAEQLQVARQLFASLGRGEWVRQCDEAMARGSREYGGGPMGGGAAPMGAQPTPAWFEPVGTWQAQISDGTSAQFTLYPNGMMQGMLMLPTGMQWPMSGQWGFDPGPGILRFRGTVGGMRPLMLAIQMQGAVPGGFAGAGSDGLGYVLRRG